MSGNKNRLEQGGIHERHSPTQFAPNVNAAETATGQPSEGPGTLPGGETTPERQGVPSIPIKFRRNANIWQLYLADAEDKSKYKVNMWYAGVDSLLIFAGLFAGVVSSFLIDSRIDLQPNSEPRLLTGIFDLLKDGSSDSRLPIPHAAYWVSGLWILSLLTTMLSVIFAILAKVGLAKHMLTIKKGQEAEDAYQQYKVDSYVDQFYGKKILVLAPLLVQVASVLFLAGLIIQTHSDNLMLGRLLLGVSLTVLLGYVALAFSPSDPSLGVSLFATPLEIVEAVWGRIPFSKSQPSTIKDPNAGLAKILQNMVSSRNPTFVNEAVAEIARPSFDAKWTDFFSQSEVPTIVFQRLVQWSTSTTDDTAEWDETLSNCLLVLISFAHVYEGKIAADGTTPPAYTRLGEVLEKYLEDMTLWDEHPKGLQILHFALQTNIMVSFTRRAGQNRPIKIPRDFNADRLRDRPWEMALRKISASHRVYFTIALCRGLVSGGENTKDLSSSALTLCLAKAACRASETGRSIEWASKYGTDQRKQANDSALQHIDELFKVTVARWKRTVPAALKEDPPVDVSLDGHSDSVIVECLILRLAENHTSYATYAHAIKLLRHSELLEFVEGTFSTSTKSGAALKRVAEMAIQDVEGIRSDGLELLIKLATTGTSLKLAELVQSAICSTLRSDISRDAEDHHHLLTIPFLDLLFHKLVAKGNDSVLATICDKVISDAIPDLFNILLADLVVPVDVRQAAVGLSQSLWTANGTPCPLKGVKPAVLDYLRAILKGKESSKRRDLFDNLKLLIVARSFPSGKARPPYTLAWRSPKSFIGGVVNTMFEDIASAAIHEEDEEAFSQAQSFLKIFAESDHFDEKLRPTITKWRKVVTDDTRARVRLNALLIVKAFLGRFKGDNLLSFFVETALASDYEEIRGASLKLALDLWKEADTVGLSRETLAGEVKEIIKSGTYNGKIQKETLSEIREKWTLLLSEIAKHVVFIEAMPIIMEVTVSQIQSTGVESQKEAVGMLEELARGPDYLETFQKSIPRDLEAKLPFSSALSREAAWVELLVSLSPIDSLRSIIGDALSGLLSTFQKTLGTLHQGPVQGFDAAGGVPESGTHLVPSGRAAPLVPRPLGTLMGESTPDGRKYWVQILTRLTGIREWSRKEHPSNPVEGPIDLPNAVNIILCLAIHDDDSDVRKRALRSLNLLANQDAIRPSFCTILLENVKYLTRHHDPNVLCAAVQLLGTFGREWDTHKLQHNADTGSKEIGSIDSAQSDAATSLATNGQPDVLDMFEQGIRDARWEHRRSWAQCILPHIKDAHRPLTTLFNVARGDDSSEVRHASATAVKRLLENVDLRRTLAPTVGKLFVEAIKEVEGGLKYEWTMTLLTQLTAPGLAIAGHSSLTTDPPPMLGHKIWVGVVMLLAQNNFKDASKIIELAIKAAPTGGHWDLNEAFGRVKLRTPLPLSLAQYLRSAIETGARDVRLRAVELFHDLVRFENGKAGASGVLMLLGPRHDDHLVSCLAKLSIKDDSLKIRKASLSLLESLFTIERFHGSVEVSLSNIIKDSLPESNLEITRVNAIQTLHTLTKLGSNGVCSFASIVSRSISLLLELVLKEREDHDVRRAAEEVLLRRVMTCRELSNKVLLSVSEVIPQIRTLEAKRVALLLGETSELTDNVASSIAYTLPPLLDAETHLPRATTIGLLAKLCSKHDLVRRGLIKGAIPKITRVALDESNDIDIRTTAIQLLVTLATPIEESTGQPNTRSKVLKQTAPLSTEFMGLIQNEGLRSSAIKLLSILSTDTTARRTIVHKIIAAFVGTDDQPTKKKILRHYCPLLVRLISDGRLGSAASDKVMLMLASIMVERPKLFQYRFEIVTALWCRYRDQPIVVHPPGLEERVLVDWFTYALFGNHATHYEVSVWLERCSVEPSDCTSQH